jgi:hypothetical protein
VQGIQIIVIGQEALLLPVETLLNLSVFEIEIEIWVRVEI